MHSLIRVFVVHPQECNGCNCKYTGIPYACMYQGIPALALLENDKDLDQMANSKPDQRLCRLVSRK